MDQAAAPQKTRSPLIFVGVAAGAILPRFLLGHVYLAPLLRHLHIWLVWLVVLAAIFILSRRREKLTAALGPPVAPARLGFVTIILAAICGALAWLAVLMVPLIGLPTQKTVVVASSSHAGWAMPRKGCRNALVLADGTKAQICLSDAQFDLARQVKGEQVEVQLKGWGSPLGMFYTDVVILGPAPESQP